MQKLNRTPGMYRTQTASLRSGKYTSETIKMAKSRTPEGTMKRGKRWKKRNTKASAE